MQNMEKPAYSYWKRPWIKWGLLVGGISELLLLWANIRNYRLFAGSDFFTAAQWAELGAGLAAERAVNGVLACCLLGSFLVGILAGSERAARLAQGVLLLLMALSLGAAGLGLGLFSVSKWGAFFLAIFLLCLGGAVYDLWKYRAMQEGNRG